MCEKYKWYNKLWMLPYVALCCPVFFNSLKRNQCLECFWKAVANQLCQGAHLAKHNLSPVLHLCVVPVICQSSDDCSDATCFRYLSWKYNQYRGQYESNMNPIAICFLNLSKFKKGYPSLAPLFDVGTTNCINAIGCLHGDNIMIISRSNTVLCTYLCL